MVQMKVFGVVVLIVGCSARLSGHDDVSPRWRWNEFLALEGDPNHKSNVTSVLFTKGVDETSEGALHHRSLELGDYVDPTFNCPATVTCPIICVASIEDCPTDALCPATSQLCADGTCADPTVGEECDPEAYSPCLCESLYFVCAKQIDLLTECMTRYQAQYEADAACLEAVENSLPQVDMTGPWFIAGYTGIAGLTVLMLIWCAWNQRWARVLGSTVSLDCFNVGVNGAKSREESHPPKDTHGGTSGKVKEPEFSIPNASLSDEEEWTLTGYKSTIVGMTLYYLVILTHWIIQLIFLALSVEYYVQQEVITTSLFGSQVFFDDVQVLEAFAITWMVGFAWCIFLKYPVSIHLLFLRRCIPQEASFVAVSAPLLTANSYCKADWISRLLSSTGKVYHRVLSFAFSDKSQRATQGFSVTLCKVRIDEETDARFFYFRFRRYIFDVASEKFIPGSWNVHEDTTIGEWLSKSYLHQGLSEDEAAIRRGIVGSNMLDLKKPSLVSCVTNEFAKPFYLYENFLIWTWVPNWYYYMALVHGSVRITGGFVVAMFQYIADKSLYQLMVKEGTVEVLRGGELVTLNQIDVVPGDIVRLVPGPAYCDMAILQAKTMLVDESSLTGEVHPIAKKPLNPGDFSLTYDFKTNKSSTIFAGTSIQECSNAPGIEGDLAIVTRTGSCTTRGALLSDVLSYEQPKFKFDNEVELVLLILAVEAIILVAFVMIYSEDNWQYNWFRAMYIVATALPPLLPTVFVVSVGLSRQRLQDMKITCQDPRSILVAGMVRKVFFDKTGTLTKQGFELHCFDEVKPVEVAKPGSFIFRRGLAVWNGMSSQKSLRSVDETKPVDQAKPSSFIFRRGLALWNASGSQQGLELRCDDEAKPVDEAKSKSFLFKRGLAVCHTLHLSNDGSLVGSDVDRVGFAASSAQMIDQDTVRFQGENFEYLKRFQFDPDRMTQSVIIKHGEETIVYAKGSPESIRRICEQSSLPPNFDEEAKQSARDGIYQLAIASSTYRSDKSIHQVNPDDIETDLDFVGFINFENTVKEESPAVIQELRGANIDCAIITGDNVLTGIHVAIKVGIIEPDCTVVIGDSIEPDGQVQWIHASDDSPAKPSDGTTLAMRGEVWDHLLKNDPVSAVEYAQRIRVYGRCTPNDKVSIVSTFVETGDIVLMCGDGGNDCGALKAAHIGIALSDAEASVVAPFTSLEKSITSVTQVLREGRCAVASALASYKYMILYGQIGCINQAINTYFYVTFSEWSWIFVDALWPITIAFSLPLAKAAKKLSILRPTASILGPHTLSSACGTIAINFLFLVFALIALWHQDWFQCRKWSSINLSDMRDISDNYEASVIFAISGYQYISSGATFNFGYSFRSNWFRNYVFVFFFILWTSLHFAATLTSGNLSCFWRLNCDNDHIVRPVTSNIPLPIENVFNTTVMPEGFRSLLVWLMVANLICTCIWDYFFVNHRSTWRAWR